ncbi:type II secretion system ATPase GspE [Kordiimonas pumila]|uniref:Type II secretion system protein E n=1 Tax=Kordiimonas pumila TaxID=2161677 RepID=A0ABV7D6D7_9PROT|nr:type II secretion system ATPase GspE [Kordiimonas pumila]
MTEKPDTLLKYGFAKDFGFAVAGYEEGAALVAMRAGADIAYLREVRRVIGQPIRLVHKSQQEFDAHLSTVYAADGFDASLHDNLPVEGLDSALEGLPQTADLLANDDDAPVIRLINGLMAEAVKTRASDVHLEPFEHTLSVRLRIDGVLAEVASLPARLAPFIVSRIKVMSRLDIAEKRLPQDGRLSLTLGEKAIDVRVSTLPSRHGERVVLRLLDTAQAHLTLPDLGMPDAVYRGMKNLLAEPNGILLVTGPTGSGKTTTLYASLSLLNDQTRNIMTVEDPVEYAVPGVSQTQVNSKVGMTFASGLRAILRQDPDVVMVGEIRDMETAEMAIQASLTGHLVLSTVHTNSAAAAVTRLKDMGVEPFLMSSTVKGVLAQRLVRKLCPVCKQPHSNAAHVATLLSITDTKRLAEPVGCPACNGTGYKGRIGIYELLHVDDTVRHLIQENVSEQAIEKHAFQNGGTLSQSGAQLVEEGITTVEEVMRVSRVSGATHAGV